MFHDGEGENPEFLSEPFSLQAPAAELLLDPPQATEAWPKEVAANEEFREQVGKRRELVASLDEVTKRIPLPTTTIEDAIANGQITEEHAARLYSSLGELLEDSDYQRVLLYLPFEFLPQATWQPEGEQLREAVDKFKLAYQTAWRDLLTIHDVRANFVDGDVLEVEQRTGDLPRVVKAAHLIPQLVQNGLLTTSSVIQLFEENDDPVLRASIADTLPVLADLSLLSDRDIHRIQVNDPQIAQHIVNRIHEKEGQASSETVPITVIDVQKELARARVDFDAHPHGNATEKRRQWLRETAIQRVMESLANRVSEAILTDNLTTTEVANFVNTNPAGDAQGVLAEGIRKAIETKAAIDPGEAHILFEQFRETFENIEKTANPLTHKLLIKTMRRLSGLGIADQDVLRQFDVPRPTVTSLLAENVREMSQELQATGEKTLAAITKSELGSVVYPVVLLYGSRIKGYGEHDADIDMAIFIRPGTSTVESARIRTVLPDVMEFWLDEEGQQLKIHNFPSESGPFGESYWAHVLFSGAWAGDHAAIDELRKKLLTTYLYETKDELYGRNARSLWLEEMEKDALQYRLMHKGYERFAPNYGGIETPNADKVDGQSMFWDSGFRRVATELYARRVFLPKLTQ